MVEAACLVLMLETTASADIRIAVVGPMTGPNASFGDQLKQGAMAAADTINGRGGVLGQKLEVVMEDDACDPRQAVSVANKIVADGIMFVNGHFCSGSTIPASEVYEESGIVSITVSTNPTVTERNFKNIFRISGRDDQQGSIAGQFILDAFKDNSIAIVHDKTSFGAGLADVVKRELAKAGVKPALETGINSGEKDFSPLLARLKDQGIGIVYFGGYHAEAGLLMRQADDHDLDIKMVGGDPLSSSEYVAIASRAADGTYFTFGPDPRRNPSASAALKVLRDRNVNVDGWAIYSYAIIETFALALERAGDADPAAVSAALHNRSFETALGSVKFDAKGDNEAPGFVVYQWNDSVAEYASE